MVLLQKNFINNYELNFFLKEINSFIQSDEIQENNFYRWYNLNPSDLESLHPYYSLVIERITKKVESITSMKDLTIDYFGFAHQTKGFPYHADNEWPIKMDDSNLGDPTFGETYTHYQGDWVPNYASIRRFTTVLYLNDYFEGGETHFPIQDVTIEPESKKIVGFYCDKEYVHGVFPTTEGSRKAFIVWFN